MAGVNGDNSAKTSEEIESNVELTALIDPADRDTPELCGASYSLKQTIGVTFKCGKCSENADWRENGQSVYCRRGRPANFTGHLSQFKVESEPVKLGGLTKKFGTSPTKSVTSMQIIVLTPKKLKEL
uniref:Uncharacterized protein n=1 Tax=Solanum tuberosum TaxID=4113 RepID=M1DE61_SOLTU